MSEGGTGVMVQVPGGGWGEIGVINGYSQQPEVMQIQLFFINLEVTEQCWMIVGLVIYKYPLLKMHSNPHRN